MPLFGRLRRLCSAGRWALAACALTVSAAAEPDESDPDEPPPIARGVAPREVGRPTVKLDRLELPAGFPRNTELERHFREQLKHAARHADWGAKRGAKIEYRVKLEELSVRDGERVVHVRCTALGSLPKGRTTRTFIDFGGSPNERDKVVRHVLEIVARGIVTRLAAIERERRAQASAN
ncbi:MAG TPA: hypothetical protein VLJ38_17780 [Polyangiaceae bacterium]|nr:hypothetical protein [Polyangiaceae bacterium]